MTNITIRDLTDYGANQVVTLLKSMAHNNYWISNQKGNKGTGLVYMIKRRYHVYDYFLNQIRIHKEITLEKLFVYARKRGYRMNRKTFTRDINALAREGKTRKKVVVGGASGTTTILKIP
jgi:23S rRNA pseudoU1915 N3-methylase RlmH